jgi:hypothetical protein
MARKLYISSDISLDEALAEVADTDPTSALLWPWLLVHLDDWGRGSANLRRLKAQIAPMNKVVTEKLLEKTLNLFAENGLIAIYEVDGSRFMAVNPDKWWKYQTHIHKGKRETDKSEIPSPPEDAFQKALQTDTIEDESRNPAENRGIPRNSAGNRASPSPSPSLHKTLAHRQAASESVFDEFWRGYPRKVGKTAAKKAWAKAVKEVDAAEIQAGLDAQLPAMAKTEARFIPHPATWLNEGRWMDEPDKPPGLDRDTCPACGAADWAWRKDDGCSRCRERAP